MKNKLSKITTVGAALLLLGVSAYKNNMYQFKLPDLNINHLRLLDVSDKTKPEQVRKVDDSVKTSDNADNKQTNSVDVSDKVTYEMLANLDYTAGTNAVKEVNGNHNELSAQEAVWSGPVIKYGALDSLNRATTATAYLDKSSLGKSEGRTAQTWSPTGQQQQPKRSGKRVNAYDRGHLVAYTLSFNFDQDGNFKTGESGSLDNPKNLFTQTSYSNRQPMQVFERKVRDALKNNKQVIYRVQPVFRNDELMARGVWVQAKSTDGSLDFNSYIFNVQDGFVFDYSTGKIISN